MREVQEGWSNEFIGKSYMTYDCWQLCVQVYSRVLHEELPDYRGEYAPGVELEHLADMMIGEASDSWVPIPYRDTETSKIVTRELRPLDLLLFWVSEKDLPQHIGIFVDSQSLLTTRGSTGSKIEQLGQWQKRLCGVYRHESMMDGESWDPKPEQAPEEL